MYKLVVGKLAQEDFEESLLWYSKRSRKVTVGFKEAVNNCFEQIIRNPKGQQNTFDDFYHIHLRKYPFTIIYTLEQNDSVILIESIFHQKRNPKDKYK